MKMTIEELKKLLDGNEEATKFVDEVFTTKDELTKQVNSLEVKFNEAKEGRDKTKERLRYVQETLGVDEINEETLAKALKRKGGDDAELQNLKQQLEKAAEERKQIEDKYKRELSTYVMKTELTKTGLAQDAYNGEMYQILEGIVLKDAQYDNGNVVFKNPDGSTAYGENGKPLSLKDRVSQIKADPRYAPMFKPSGNGGTGTKGVDGKPSTNKIDLAGSKQERARAIAERYGLS